MNFKQWYEHKAHGYQKVDQQGVKRYQHALRHVKVSDNMQVVDIGCKSLSLLMELSNRKIRCNYYGIDISEAAIHKSDITFGQKPGICISDVMEGIPLQSDSVHRVFCLEVIEHVSTPLFLLQEIHRILKPDGLAIVSCPNPYYYVNIIDTLFNIKENEGHISCFRWQEMLTLSKFAGLNLLASRKTFSTFPPMKSNFHIYPKAFNSLCSESIQYILGVS